jgi:hypothetical protein
MSSVEQRRRWRVNTRRYKEQHLERVREGNKKAAAKRRANGFRDCYDPIKDCARVALHKAIKDGTILRPDACSECGRVSAVHGHHHDYSKPLNVEWLCSVCHGKRHTIAEVSEAVCTK